jgi:hypothetical protein
MPNITFSQFLNRFGIKLLFSADPTLVPGAVIDKRKKGYFAIGALKEVLGGSDVDWETELLPANLVYGTVEREISLEGKASLKEFGMDIKGGLERASSVTFKITGVKSRIFKKQSSLLLAPQLFKLRDTNKNTWKRINNNWIADHTYYATEATVEFVVDSSVNLEADLKDRLELSGNAAIEWKSKRSFVITQNDLVPFGFSGWRV